MFPPSQMAANRVSDVPSPCQDDDQNRLPYGLQSITLKHSGRQAEGADHHADQYDCGYGQRRINTLW